MPTIKEQHVLVIGEGPAGLMTSILAAASSNIKVTLVKKRSGFTRNQILFLNKESLDLLKEINVFAKLNIKTFVMEKQERGLIEIKKLEKCLYNKLNSLGITILQGKFIDIQNDKAFIQTENEVKEFPYDILVGADGAGSQVRKTLKIKCNKIGLDHLVGSSFLPHLRSDTPILHERVSSNFFLRKVQTPVGCFVLLHSRTAEQLANKQAIAEAAEASDWNLEAEQMRTADQPIVHVENVRAQLKQAQRFADEENRVILVGDATATGSFYLGRGANLALKSALLAKNFFLDDNQNRFQSYNKKMLELSDSLIESNKHLFNDL